MSEPRALNQKVERTVGQADRALLLAHPEALAYRKRSRILAIQMQAAFTVETDRGPMKGSAGDFLVTNHPEDDPGSDLWTSRPSGWPRPRTGRRLMSGDGLPDDDEVGPHEIRTMLIWVLIAGLAGLLLAVGIIRPVGS